MWVRALEVRSCASHGHFSSPGKVFFNGHYKQGYERNIVVHYQLFSFVHEEG
mgnify:CR=1 FL=1